jgi:hypothetical protein
MAGQPTCRLRDVDGIRENSSGDVTFSADASAPVRHDQLGIIVVGDTPYSEGFGDVGGPLWAYDPGDNGVPPPINKGDANHHPLYAFGYGLTTR